MKIDNRDRIVPYLQRLFRYAWSLTKADDKAQDLVQDAARKVLSAGYAPIDEAAYRAWLFKILRNQFLDDQRHAGVMDRHAAEIDGADSDFMEYGQTIQRIQQLDIDRQNRTFLSRNLGAQVSSVISGFLMTIVSIIIVVYTPLTSEPENLWVI